MKKNTEFNNLAKIWKSTYGCYCSYACCWINDKYRKNNPTHQSRVVCISNNLRVIENIGWAIISNLHILFAPTIGGSWAKDRAGGAFSAGLSFILINRITGSIFGGTNEMLADPDAFTHTIFGTKIMVKGFFTSILEAPALNMGVFVGIIAGFVGAMAYNKYYNYRKLPDALSFGLHHMLTIPINYT